MITAAAWGSGRAYRRRPCLSQNRFGHLLPMLVGVSLACWATATLAQDKYAIVIGVETYDTSTFDNLDYAAEDADELGASLQKMGFQVTVMSSESRSARLRPTTPKKIADVIKSVVASCANGDTLLISLSGHGVQFSDEELLSSGVRETYFCPSEANLADKASLLKVTSVVDFMNSAAAGRKLLLVDACQEHVLSSEGKKKGAKRIELGSVHENRRSVPGGMAVLFSCSSGQFSWEHDAIGHSVFTYHVIEYLNGKAENRFYDSNQVDLNGLVFYVAKRTNDYVIGKNLSPDGQLPVMRGSSANWPLGKLEAVTVEREFTNSIGMKMVLLPAGTFMMGSPTTGDDRGSDEDQHRVTLTQDFYLGTTEVTQGQWESVMGTTPWKGQVHVKEGSNFAATYVSWEDAVKFCKRLSSTEGKTYRLPTEAEWEYACRGGTTSAFSFGAANTNLSEYGWWGGILGDGNAKSERYAHEVGLKRANAFGFFDMHGNVNEWCSDWYAADYYLTSPSRDPLGPSEGSDRVLRGGSWRSNALECRLANRDRDLPGNRNCFLGFRVAADR